VSLTSTALVVKTDRVGFMEAWAIQRALVGARRADAIPDVIWLLEHDPVYTTGRHGTRTDLFMDDAALVARGARFAHTDRGGLMTWHGPGQSVAYVIHDLRGRRRVRPFVSALAEAMADASGVEGAQSDDSTMGAYVEGRKIGSVGIRVAGGISMHGIALNRDVDLTWYQAITACGAPEVVATSIAVEGGDPDRARVEGALAAALGRRLGRELRQAELDAVLPAEALRIARESVAVEG